MRKIILVFAAGLLFVTTVVFAAVSPSLFTEANAKYRAGDFKAAAGLYHKIIDTGRASGAVYYNLGNTVLRLNQKGEALLYYERALKASPRDRDLIWNIQVLKSTLSDRIEDVSPNPLLTPVKKILHRATLDEISFLFSGALAVFTLLSLLGLLFPAARGFFGSLGTPAVFLMLVFGVSFGVKWFATKDPRAVVLDKEVTAYYGPSDKETKAFILHEGAEGKILDQSQDWVYISLKNKNTGWIRKNSCEII